MSGPDTSGSAGLNGIPFTNEAPENIKQTVIILLGKKKQKQESSSDHC